MARDQEGALVAIIADEDTITGFLLAGVGEVDLRRRANFLVVDAKTTVRAIEQAFKDFGARDDIAIILISQPIANMIRNAVANHDKVCCLCVLFLLAICVSMHRALLGGCWLWGGWGARALPRARQARARAAAAAAHATNPPPLSPPPSSQAIPAVLEIPSKDSPYDPNQDSLLNRVKHLLGME
jgi:ATP synthase F subunit